MQRDLTMLRSFTRAVHNYVLLPTALTDKRKRMISQVFFVLYIKYENEHHELLHVMERTSFAWRVKVLTKYKHRGIGNGLSHSCCFFVENINYS